MGFFERYAGPESPHDAEYVASPIAILRVVKKRFPELRSARIIEAGRRNPHNFCRSSSDFKGLPEDILGPAEALLPESVPDDHHVRSAGYVLLGTNITASNR